MSSGVFTFFRCVGPLTPGRVPPVHQEGHRRRHPFGDPEGVPHPLRPQGPAEEEGRREHHHQVAAQGDDQGGQALPQPLQGPGGGHRHRGDQKADADHPQGGLPRLDGLGVGGEQAHHRPGNQLAHHRPRRHDAGAHGQHHPVDLLHPAGLPRPVVVPHQGAHPLDEAVGGEVEEGLELVIDPQHQHVDLGPAGQDAVEGRDQHRRQGQVQGGGDAHAVQPAGHGPPGAHLPPGDVHRQGAQAAEGQVDPQREALADAGGQGGPGHPQLGEGAQAEDQQRVQDDVGHAPAQQAHHGGLHPAHRLKNLLKAQPQDDDEGEGKSHLPVLHPQGQNGLRLGEPPQKGGQHPDAPGGEDHPVDHCEGHPLAGCPAGLFPLPRPQVEGDHRVDANAEAHPHGGDEVLHRVDQGQGGHGVLADLGHEEAVHDVVQGVDQHGQHHGQGHGQHQGEDGAFLHKTLVHGRFLLS